MCRMYYNLLLVVVLSYFRCKLVGASLTSGIFKGIFNEPTDDSEKVVEVVENKAPELEDPNVIDLRSYGFSLYGEPDFNKTGHLVAAFDSHQTAVNPEELGAYLEGDILIPQNSRILKNGINTSAYRWPNGVVPFEIAGDFTQHELDIIALVFDEFHSKTCIRFKTRTSETDYISLHREHSGCWSAIGRVGGKQQVNLQAPGCFTKLGTVIHELMHVLGFMHEQNRKERDSFVEIQFQNVQRHAEANFQKMPDTVAFGIGYDYGSVMHYSSTAFSSNGQPTIVPKRPSGRRQAMGQRYGFSVLDIEKVKRMYNCELISKPPEPPLKLHRSVSTGSPFTQKLFSHQFGTIMGKIFRGWHT